MPRYIDADRLLDSIKKSANECRNWKAEAIDDEIKARADAGLAAFIECALRVEHQPTADVEEVKHGEWEDNKVAFYRMCSECGCGVRSRRDVVLFNFIDHQYYYCPNCGAKMGVEHDTSD